MRIPFVLCLLAATRVQAQSLFAPGIISRPDSAEAFGSLTPDGKEFYFTIHRADFSRHRIVVARRATGGWSAPETLPISGVYNDREPKLSPDGRRLYFSSNRPLAAGDTTRRRDLDLWFSDRRSDGSWSSPKHIEGANGPSNDFSPSVTANGTLYFISNRRGGIGKDSLPYNVWRAEPLDLATGRWKAPVNAGSAINAGFETNVFVTPDESLMLVSRDGSPDTFGGDDIYFSRRAGSGAWQAMKHLPAPINTKEYEYGPLVSPDGRFLFVTSHRTGNGDIYRFSIGELERDDVARAGYDYIDGFYEGDTAKLGRALRPELSKYGFWRDSTGKYAGERMTYREAIDYAKRVKARNQPVQSSWPRQVEVLDVQDMTAVAKVTAWWGTDYLLLGRYDGRWMIANVLWQGP